MKSAATTVDAYLAELPADRREALEAVRKVILANLDSGYEEGIQYGMLGYYVPHTLYPPGYHCDPRIPLPFVNLASQKNYMSLYLGFVYSDGESDQWFRREWEKTGKKLDMGKSCIRFRNVDDLALDVIGTAISRMPVDKWIHVYESSLESAGRPVKKATKEATTHTKASTKKRAAKKATKSPARKQ